MTAQNKPRRWLAIALVAAAVGGMAAAGAGTGIGQGHGHGHGHGSASFDPAKAEQHISMMVAHVLPDGTPEQKARLAEISRACFNDVMPIQKQLRDGHKEVHRLLAEPAVDRAALEILRAQQMKNMDRLSRRILQTAVDAAEVLSVEQRQMFNKGLHMMAMGSMHHQ